MSCAFKPGSPEIPTVPCNFSSCKDNFTAQQSVQVTLFLKMFYCHSVCFELAGRRQDRAHPLFKKSSIQMYKSSLRHIRKLILKFPFFSKEIKMALENEIRQLLYFIFRKTTACFYEFSDFVSQTNRSSKRVCNCFVPQNLMQN